MKNLSKQVGVYRRPNSNKLKLVTNPLIPIGDEFGWWVVLENDLYKSFSSQTMRACRVRCRCGTVKVLTYGELRCGRSPSCGCKSKERNIETIWNDLFEKHKRRGWEFHLTLPQFKVIVQRNCAYCDKEPSNIHRLKYKIDGVYKRISDPSLEIRYSGLDRVDTSKGYIAGNMVPCCFGCNKMKSVLSVDEFFALMERIRLHSSTANAIRELAASL
jgi:hypothetical protein